MTRRLASRWLPIAAACLAIAVHARTLGVGFVYDDYPYVVENADLRGPWPRAGRLVTESFPSRAPERALYRPLTALTLFADARGLPLDPRRFHATNLALTALAVLAAHGVLKRLLPAAQAGGAALLFAVHPAHVEAIAWISGRSELLAGALACFAVAAAIDAARGGAILSGALAGVSLGLGILAKESAATAVPLAGLALAADARVRRHTPERSHALRILVVLVLVALAVVALRSAVLGRFAPDPGERVLEGSLVDRLPLALAATGEHLRLLILPWPLSVDRMPVPPASWTDLRVLAGAAGIAAWLALAVFLARRNAISRAALAIWPLVALLPVAHLVPIGETVAERFLVLPSIGVVGLAGSLLVAGGRLARVALVALVALGAGASWARVETWRDERALWQDALDRAESSPTPLAALGDAELRAGDPHAAIARYRQALALAPDLTVARLNLARALDAAGEPAQALAESEEAVRRDPTDAVALNHWGARLARAGSREEARARFDHAVALAPSYGPALLNAALAALEGGDAPRALDLVRRARRVDPSLPGLEEIERRLAAPSPRAHEPR